jgi:elongation factor Ts
MEISASLVKELREKTGVGMMDCKKALDHAKGNFEEAIKYLREKGLAAVSKKSDREAKEGKVFTAIEGQDSVIVEVNCETDFVANNADFIAFGNAVAKTLVQSPGITLDTLPTLAIGGKAFSEALSELVLKLGENITVKRFDRLYAQAVSSYIHTNGKIGVIVGFSAAITPELGRDIAMHIAASSPLCVSSKDVPPAELEKEKDIIRTQALNEGKPEAVVEKVIAGRISKYFKEMCLVDQAFVKDQDKSVSQVLGSIQATAFVRYSLG